jgi:hypothetical protein
MNRQEFLKSCARGGALAGLIGLSAVLASREKKFECSNVCGRCAEFNNGKCGLGLK